MIQFLNATGSASMTETLFTLLPMILIIVFMFILIYAAEAPGQEGRRYAQLHRNRR